MSEDKSHTPRFDDELAFFGGKCRPEGPDPEIDPEKFAAGIDKCKRERECELARNRNPKTEPDKPRDTKEDFNQATHRVFEEIARRSETTPKP
jgi:hypothetical protein